MRDSHLLSEVALSKIALKLFQHLYHFPLCVSLVHKTTIANKQMYCQEENELFSNLFLHSSSAGERYQSAAYFRRLDTHLFHMHALVLQALFAVPRPHLL